MNKNVFYGKAYFSSVKGFSKKNEPKEAICKDKEEKISLGLYSDTIF